MNIPWSTRVHILNETGLCFTQHNNTFASFLFPFFPFFKKKSTLLLKYILKCMKSSDAKASKCHLKFSSLMMIFIELVYLSSVILLK